MQRTWWFALLLSAVLAWSAIGATFVVPSDEEMVAKSAAIAIATVEGSFAQQTDNVIETVYEMRIERTLKGRVGARDDLARVVALGGVIDDRGMIVPGEAHFRQGERVLLFLTRDAKGRWRTTDFTLGKFRFVTSTRGEHLLVRDMEDVVGWDHAGRAHEEKVRREAGFLRFIEERVQGRAATTDYVVEASEVTLAPQGEQASNVTTNAAPFPGATYTDWVNDQPIRWPNLSSGITVYKRSDQDIAGASDGGVSVIQNALAAWTNECGSTIVLNYGGQIAKASANHDGTNVVEFNDPQQRISGSWSGSGTVGICFISFAGTHAFEGASWLNITDMDVVFQDGYTAANASFPTAMTHEVGHGLGWRHSNQDYATGGACNSSTQECTTAAIMNSSVNPNYGYTLQPWDVNAAQSVYPGGTCSTCTAPSITSQPASTTVTAGTSVTLSVSATGTTPLTYQWYVGTSGSTGSPISGATGPSLTVTPSATTSYWVRVSNACGAANSATATITVSASTPPSQFARNRTRADFDFDRKSEMLWRHSSSNDLAMWDFFGRSISASVLGPLAAFWVIEGFGDFDGNGTYDILFRNTNTLQIAVWLMNGRNVTAAAVVTTLGDATWSFDAFGDFTGDGKTDILVRHPSSGNVAMWELNGTTFTNGDLIASVADLNWRIQRAGDFDGDGDDEVLWRHMSTHQLGIWEFSGRTLTNAFVFSTLADPAWQVQGLGDFNNDNRDDILWRHSGTNNVAVWTMNGRTYTSAAIIGRVSSSAWRVAAIGDYGGDGDDEVIWFNTTTGEVAMWEIANEQLIDGGLIGAISPAWIPQPPKQPVM